MKIVFLDAYTTNPGDISLSEISALGELFCYDRTLEKQIVGRAKEADVVITNKTSLSADTIKRLPKLKYICVAATGFNIVDIAAARKYDVPVSNVKAYSTDSVAQLVFSHILNLMIKIDKQSESVKNGNWYKSSDFSYCNFPLFELTEMTIGIIGFGNIGRAVAQIANGFKMKINVYKPGEILNKPEYVTQTDKQTIFKNSDIITLHCPLVEETNIIINKESLRIMKKTAYLINTGRGGLINENELAEALNNKLIAGAGLDVLSEEPPRKNNPLIGAENCFVTPHVAWATVNARKRLVKGLTDNIKAYICGKPINVVN